MSYVCSGLFLLHYFLSADALGPVIPEGTTGLYGQILSGSSVYYSLNVDGVYSCPSFQLQFVRTEALILDTVDDTPLVAVIVMSPQGKNYFSTSPIVDVTDVQSSTWDIIIRNINGPGYNYQIRYCRLTDSGGCLPSCPIGDQGGEGNYFCYGHGGCILDTGTCVCDQFPDALILSNTTCQSNNGTNRKIEIFWGVVLLLLWNFANY